MALHPAHGAVRSHQRSLNEQLWQWFAFLCLTGAAAWVFWPTLTGLERNWRVDPDQAHGYLVVPFVLYLIWSRRDRLTHAEGRPALVLGLLAIATGLALRFAGVFAYFDWLQAAALAPVLGGLVLLTWGWEAALICAGPLAFLLFMIPLPYRLATALAWPMQRLAAVSSTYMLETLGCYASCVGTTIHIGDQSLSVVAACSGMKILMTFFALSVGMALCQPHRLWWDRLLVVLAAIPVALAANVIRIVTTAVLYRLGEAESAKTVYHDFAGWLMMPAALALLGIWVWVLRLCVIVDARDVTQRTFLPKVRTSAST